MIAHVTEEEIICIPSRHLSKRLFSLSKVSEQIVAIIMHITSISEVER